MELSSSLDSIDCHRYLVLCGVRLQDRDVINSFSIAVVYLVCFPIRGQARRKAQPVRFQLQSQK